MVSLVLVIVCHVWQCEGAPDNSGRWVNCECINWTIEEEGGDAGYSR